MIAMNDGPSRLGLAALLAAPLVYGLFLAANALIAVNDIDFIVIPPSHMLSQITPADPPTMEARERTLLPPLKLKVQPPSLVSYQPRTPPAWSDAVWSGLPAEALIDQAHMPMQAVNPMDGRAVTPVRAPAPSIPAAARSRGLSGSCEVHFDVDTGGRPKNIFAQCTDGIFKAEAERAVARAEFLPAIRGGVAVVQQDAIYPIEFRVN